MYAKTGDSLSIEFTVNNTIASSNASILESGLNQTITQTSRDLNYTVIVPSTQREEYANFNVQVTDIVRLIYALVGAFDDDGVQIINITDPYNPTNASSITDSAEYPKLNGPLSITSTTIVCLRTSRIIS